MYIWENATKLEHSHRVRKSAVHARIFYDRDNKIADIIVVQKKKRPKIHIGQPEWLERWGGEHTNSRQKYMEKWQKKSARSNYIYSNERMASENMISSNGD